MERERTHGQSAHGGATRADQTWRTSRAAWRGNARRGSFLPTGEQFTISHRGQRAVVTEVGATLRSFTLAGRELLDTFSRDAMSTSARGQVLLPWPNRIADGRYTFLGQAYQLPLSEPRYGNASHGLTRWLNWELVRRTRSQVVLGLVLHPQPGYPFTLVLAVEYALSRAGLRVRTTARNVGATPLPFGAGHHPYFTVGTARIDSALLCLRAETYLTTNDRLIPTGRASVAGSDFDFRTKRPIGGTRLDTCFTDLRPDADGETRVELSHPSGAPAMTLTLDASYRFIQAFTGDTLPDREARRSIAIEPMTCAPDAFNSGDGLRILEPGQACTSEWGIVA